MPEEDLAERCEREVVELHRFFQEWMTGRLEEGEESFARFDDVIAEGFTIVSPGGVLVERGPLVENVRRAHGVWTPGDRIWIEAFRLHRAEGGVALVTYEEWQERSGEVRGRVSTALLRRSEGGPNGLEWLHVHETWLPAAGE